MAKKYPFRRKKHPRRHNPGGSSSGPLPAIMDRRAIEGAMWTQMEHIIGNVDTTTPLYQAQQIAYQAFGVPDPKERVRLAKKALDLSPDCADAYVLLAEHAQSRKETLDYFEKGVAAGERALGPDAFQEHLGHFWGVLATRPYMRAREGLAHALWVAGRHDEAVSHLQDMLRLNPNDNQGLRLTLASWLPYLNRDQELADLLSRYDGVTATWTYTKALLAFRQQGDTPESRKLLDVAKKDNSFVLEYLLDDEPLPMERPDHYGLGDRNEAIIYAADALKVWKSTPGAITWVRDVFKKPQKQSTPAEKTIGPTAQVKEQLKRVPQGDDTWLACYRQFPKWIEDNGDRVLPWVILAVNRDSGLVVTTNLVAQEPTADLLWDKLAEAIRRPSKKQPYRPTRIQVAANPRWNELKPHLGEIGIELETTRKLEVLDDAFENLKQYMTEEDGPGLLDMPRVTPESAGRFFKAAAAFYRKAPWKLLGDENAIKIECDRFQSGPWYAVVMGQSGITLGLVLYEDLSVLKSLWANEAPDREPARQSIALAITFDTKLHIHPKDFEAAQRYGWDVAGPEAYPWVYRKELGMTVRPPLSWELVLLEGCLQVIPEFVSKRKLGDMTKQQMTVAVGTGKLDLVLSWVDQG
jgi:tetratricopeptide (TPR) repeat protein